MQHKFNKKGKLNRLKHIVNAVIWTIAGLYFTLVILLHLSAVKGAIGSEASDLLAHKLGTRVSIGNVDLGFLNRFIIDDVLIYDQHGGKLLKSSRASVKIDIIQLFQGKISITSAQLFGSKINAYKQTADSKANYQFALDSLASKNKKSKSNLDLKIGSLIIRNGALTYNQYDAVQKYGQLDPKHLNISGISAHIILNALTNDSINLNIRKMAFKDVSGLNIVSLSTKVVANRKQAELNDFELMLPGTVIRLGDCLATYTFLGKELQIPSLQYSGSLDESTIRPSDFSCFLPALKSFRNKLDISTTISGTSTSVRIHSLGIIGRSIYLNANGSLNNWQSKKPRWVADIKSLSLKGDGIKFISNNLGKQLSIPIEITRLGNIVFKGAIGGYGKDVATKGMIRTDVGSAKLALGINGKNFSGHVETDGISVGKIINNNKLGIVATKINADGYINGNDIKINAKGHIGNIEYNRYTYRNINIDGLFSKKKASMHFNGKLDINDPNGKIAIKGDLSKLGKITKANITAAIDHFNPNALKLIGSYPSTVFSANLSANFIGDNINNADGRIVLSDFDMRSPKDAYHLNSMEIHAGKDDMQHFLTMNSDFGQADIIGKFDYATIFNSITNIIHSKLPSLMGLKRGLAKKANNFSFNAYISKSDWLNKIFGVDIDLAEPATLSAIINDHRQQIDFVAQMPSFSVGNNIFENGHVKITSPNDSLKAEIQAKKISKDGKGLAWNIETSAADNKLKSIIKWKNLSGKYFTGTLNTETEFYKSEYGNTAHITVHHSDIIVGDSVWNIQPSDIVYRKNNITIDHFAVTHNNQHVIISGLATPNKKDSVIADLQKVDVSYILNLVNFHSVDFSGKASGKAYIAGAFSKPDASAKLRVEDFKFENGRMGVLYADASWNNREGQIDIDATANDTISNMYISNSIIPIKTIIKGYVSPRKNNIDLNITADGTRIEFLKRFCGSFMGNINAYASGDVRVAGPLNRINLTGDLIANGVIHMSTLNTDYTLKNAHIHAIPDEIYLQNDTVTDRDGHIGIVSGALHHQHLTKLTFDIGINAHNLLAYDTHEFGDNTFYGTAYTTGTCNIKGRNNDITIDVKATANKGSQIVYNVSSPTSISKNEFIHWTNRDSVNTAFSIKEKPDSTKDINIPTDMHINFLINMTPEATIKLIMDHNTGDYISLNGTGGLRAAYYNNGSFDLYGNYLIDHGIYKLTIQNAIKKDFMFTPGGTISFGGDPFDAVLNLKAQYTVQGVSLADLKIGNSFSNNNIRVNCLMNITGTPSSPKVDFGLDMPTVNNDAKQMILNLINSEEEMNQQVLYLLAIGRFYTQTNNNAVAESTTQQSQTSLAMQSILSGTVSQQLNNVLSSVINNTNWNFGANISTGDEGWNNAEYEGMLSGRLLNNRLQFSGQFGYRDNANATTSFIGDFDLRYLLYPNGNFAIRVYNQTNDRYFTRNSLNTQGIGFILKKDFNGFWDLFGIKKKPKK